MVKMVTKPTNQVIVADLVEMVDQEVLLVVLLVEMVEMVENKAITYLLPEVMHTMDTQVLLVLVQVPE